MRLSTFILTHLDTIVDEWVAFARQLSQAGPALSESALADHSREILSTIAEDMDTAQGEPARQAKARGHAASHDRPGRTAAGAHGAVRLLDGFDLDDMVAEYRALRTCVLKHWRDAGDGVQDRREAVEEIARFNEAIDQAIAESVHHYTLDVARSRDLFLGVLGHDLRNPLGIIDNSAAVLDRPDLSLFARQQAVERVRRASWRMRSLITSLLDYTQARSGHGLTVTRASCDLRKTCEDVIDATRAAYPRQRFAADLAGDLTMAVDGNRVEQMLGNLLANAAQHGAPGGLVSLTARGGADEVVLSVRNTGQPIPQELLPTIFDPLVQGPRAAADHSIGLGLFIVREIVRGHQGRIDVASTQAGGTVFTVRLPRPAP